MDLSALSDEELVGQLTTWAGRVAAGEAHLLHLIGELDTRGTWAVHGVVSCAHWLSWQLGLSLTTARERVRVARALRALPKTEAALADGQLSYAQVRAITRIATADDETVWVELAQHCTGAQLDKAARGAARSLSESADQPPRPAATVRWDESGDLVLTLRFPAAQAPAVLAALEQHQKAEQVDRDSQLAAVAEQIAPDTSAEAWEPYVYEEPPYPLSQRIGLFDKRTPEELRAIAEWEAERDRRRALRDASRAQQERLELEAATRHVPTGGQRLPMPWSTPS